MTINIDRVDQVISHCRENGVILRMESGKLCYRSTDRIDGVLLSLLKEWKGRIQASILDPLVAGHFPGLSPEDICDLKEERAAILEYDAGICRTEAEWRLGITFPARA